MAQRSPTAEPAQNTPSRRSAIGVNLRSIGGGAVSIFIAKCTRREYSYRLFVTALRTAILQERTLNLSAFASMDVKWPLLLLLVFFHALHARPSPRRPEQRARLRRRGLAAFINKKFLPPDPAPRLGETRPPIPPLNSTPSFSVHPHCTGTDERSGRRLCAVRSFSHPHAVHLSEAQPPHDGALDTAELVHDRRLPEIPKPEVVRSPFHRLSSRPASENRVTSDVLRELPGGHQAMERKASEMTEGIVPVNRWYKEAELTFRQSVTTRDAAMTSTDTSAERLVALNSSLRTIRFQELRRRKVPTMCKGQV